jgi:YfiH family protein
MTVASGSTVLSGVVDADPAVRFTFSDVEDGNMSLTVGQVDGTARQRLAAAVGVRPGDMVFMQQVHGAGVAVVDVTDRGRGSGAHADGVQQVDALVTFDCDVALAVLVADCVPVIVSDPHRAVAVIHAGRGGVMTGVVQATLDAIASPAPDRLRAIIGPAIGGCCYEVPPELAERVAAKVPTARSTTTWGTSALDLSTAVDAQLRASGVVDVSHVGKCTRCDGQRWFSHRRAPGMGRQAGAVVRSSGAPLRQPAEGRHGYG